MSQPDRIKLSMEFPSAWFAVEIPIAPGEDVVEEFRKGRELIIKSYQEITPGQYGGVEGHPMSTSKPPASTIDLIISEMNKVTAIDKRNSFGVQEGLLAYADKFLDNPTFRVAYDKKMEELKN